MLDEPSVWDYAPQHQSACGFRFNGPAPGRARFGPEFWAHDALVTGESRGKLWRTHLVKTAAGYVARTEQFAALVRANRAIDDASRKADVSCASVLPKDLGDWAGTAEFVLGANAAGTSTINSLTVASGASLRVYIDGTTETSSRISASGTTKVSP